MDEQYFGIKDLYQVVLKATTDMNFGSRTIQKGEPILYFNRVQLAEIAGKNAPKFARGGRGNIPHVIWEDRSDVSFLLTEGVVTQTGLAVLNSANLLQKPENDILKIPKCEGPFEISPIKQYTLKETPIIGEPAFCYRYERKTIQEKVNYTLDGKVLTIENGQSNQSFIFDYYYNYAKEALIYMIEKERFNGTFLLEAKFYAKDENDGLNHTNIIVMPKVRVVSNLNLRLGEKADPTVSVFNILAMPVRTEESESMIMKIIYLNEDIDADI